MYGQKIGRVGQLLDQGELFFQLPGDLFRNTVRIAAFSALPGELRQMALRRCAMRDRFVRIFIRQLIQAELARR